MEPVPHTFVRTVKAQDLSFSQVDPLLDQMKATYSPSWVVLGFAVRCVCLCCTRSGRSDLTPEGSIFFSLSVGSARTA